MHVAGGFGTRASHAKDIASGCTKDAFGKVTAAGIAGAENENERLVHCEANESAAAPAATAAGGFGETHVFCEAVGVFRAELEGEDSSFLGRNHHRVLRD